MPNLKNNLFLKLFGKPYTFWEFENPWLFQSWLLAIFTWTRSFALFCGRQFALLGQTESPPHARVRAFFLFYNPKNVHCRSTGLPHAFLLMKISPTDAHEEKPFWPFGAMKGNLGWFGHARVRAFGTIPGPLPYPHEILLQGFGHRVRVRALTQTTIWGVREFNLMQNDWFGHSCRQLGGFGHLPLLQNKLLLAFEMTCS